MQWETDAGWNEVFVDFLLNGPTWSPSQALQLTLQFQQQLWANIVWGIADNRSVVHFSSESRIQGGTSGRSASYSS
jgi:hypothetical protein